MIVFRVVPERRTALSRSKRARCCVRRPLDMPGSMDDGLEFAMGCYPSHTEVRKYVASFISVIPGSDRTPGDDKSPQSPSMPRQARIGRPCSMILRVSSADIHRSPPQQIEHWAQVGRVMEAALSYPAQSKVKAVSMQDTAMGFANTPSGKLKAQDVIRETSVEIVSND